MTAAPLPPRVQLHLLVPFVVVTLIWGSTWLVIRHQLGIVPPVWSVTYRFVIAGAAMMAVAIASRTPLRLGFRGQGIALAIGVAQFLLNYNLVYRAEAHVTSGVVATVFALLIVPNAVLGRLLLGEGLSARFLAGSAVALAGVGLLFAHELGANPAAAHQTELGIALTIGAILAASCANVLQATPPARALPIVPMLGWAMLWGAGMDAAFAWATAGSPVLDLSAGYLAGLVYLAIVASSLAFFLYYRLIRAMGAARAAYSNVLIPIIAMTLSTLFEGYRWSPSAIAGAVLVLAGLVIAIRARSPSR